jgi:hypothetical protein
LAASYAAATGNATWKPTHIGIFPTQAKRTPKSHDDDAQEKVATGRENV